MEKTAFKGLGKEYADPTERERFLKDNADAVVNKAYFKPFTADKLAELKEEHADICAKIAEVEDEKAEVMAEFKERLKPLTEGRNERLSKIRRKGEDVEELCYKFVDQDQRMTLFYNKLGDCIEARPCTADELQATVFTQLRATGTDN